MKFQRRNTQPGIDPLDQVEHERRRSVIANPDGSIVFEAKDVETPRAWSQLATDIVVSKYFRRAGVPGPDGRENSVRQVVTRVARSIRKGGEAMGGYFDTPEDAQTFEDELTHLLVTQKGAFNSPVWFNCGLFHEYGIKGSGGNWAWDEDKQEVFELANNYERPQCSACFIQSVGDDLMSIFELAKTEARIFKYGSGTGTNFSRLRSKYEKLSGGGTSSGLMSFLEVLDRGAGATKSGGTTRRAAKMVCLDMDHPEILDFIEWKVREENKARVLIEHGGMAADFNGEAYHTVAGQNSNNSVRVVDAFMRAALSGQDWQTTERTSGEIHATYPAAEMLEKISQAAWRCADPGVQFDTSINEWHTCPATDKIRASNPCSEYMFLDDSACNLSSINLLEYLDERGEFDIEGYKDAIRLFFTAQEILVDFSSYPTAQIARNSHDYRPLGLGYANLGAMLMTLGIPYDSPEGTAMCGALTSILTGHAYAVSAEMARDSAPFPGYKRNEKAFLRVMRKHRAAVDAISAEFCSSALLGAARECWDRALELGEIYGYRNAQATVLAPTGTIGLLMDCDTTGIEPDFSLVKFKKLAGGGYFKIVNQAVPPALRTLGYNSGEIQEILRYINGTASFRGTHYVNEHALKAKGFDDEDLTRLEKALRGSMDLGSVFTKWNLSAELVARLGFTDEQLADPGFNMLRALGFTEEQIDADSEIACGTQTIEGAPHLRQEHYPVFDCANRCGHKGRRFIAPMGHVRMMAAAQPFISGAISKTVNLPNEATVDDIKSIYVEAWRLGLKAIALYRDGCKMSQPLSSKKEKTKETPAVATAVSTRHSEKTAGDILDEALREVEGVEAPEVVTIKVPTPMRRRLPQRRRGITVESRVGGHKIFLRTGEYTDNTLGEVFIDMHKEGAAFRSLMNAFAIAVSKGLQYGVPLKDFVDTFTFTRFEPQGMCDHPNIKMVTSVIDYVFRVLGLEYLGRTDFCQVPPTKDEEEIDKLISPTESAHEAQRMLGEGPATEAMTTAEAPRAAVETAEAPRQPAMAASGAIGGGYNGGAGNGHRAAAAAKPARRSGLDSQMSKLMGDAPFCDHCGSLTVRNGSCYKCLNCGSSVGCS